MRTLLRLLLVTTAVGCGGGGDDGGPDGPPAGATLAERLTVADVAVAEGARAGESS